MLKQTIAELESNTSSFLIKHKFMSNTMDLFTSPVV